MWGIENFNRIEKIEAVLFKVRHPLLVVPFKLHCSFYIQIVYKSKWVICRTKSKFCDTFLSP